MCEYLYIFICSSLSLSLFYSLTHSFQRLEYSTSSNDDRVYRFVESGLIELLLRKSSARKAACVRFLCTCYKGSTTITAAAVCTILRSNKCQLTLRLSRLPERKSVFILFVDLLMQLQIHRMRSKTNRKFAGKVSLMASFDSESGELLENPHIFRSPNSIRCRLSSK